mgnify:CR=1 FL=1
MLAPNINNVENYQSKLHISTNSVFKNYINIIDEFLVLANENIYINKQQYYKYIIIHGIKTVTHIFNILFLYTKNLELTFYHMARAFVYYVEFIGQIGDDNHAFLQLSSKDASLFIYKKTIYEIDVNYRKNHKITENDSITFNNITKLINLYNSVLFIAINNSKLENDKTIITIHKYMTKKFLKNNLANFLLHIEYYLKIIFFMRDKISYEKILSLISTVNKNYADKTDILVLNKNLLVNINEDINDSSVSKLVKILIRK